MLSSPERSVDKKKHDIRNIYSLYNGVFSNMTKQMKKPSTRIKRRLRVLGISQTELAHRLQKNVSLVNYFCIHGVKTVRVAKEYARILCCRPEELLEI